MFQKIRDREFFHIAVLSIAIGIILRLFLDLNCPLWLDESIGAAIAVQSSVVDIVRLRLVDANPPLYDLASHLSVYLLGAPSNLNLRIPALLAGFAAPFACFIRFGDKSNAINWIWSVFVSLSLFPIIYTSEARPYSFEVLFGVLNSVFFVRWILYGRKFDAFLWSLFSSVLILSHYISLFLIFTQIIISLFIFKRRIFYYWASVVNFIPAVILFVAHSPRLRDFSRPEYSWYAPLKWSDFLAVGALIFGTVAIASLLGIGLSAALQTDDRRRLRRRWADFAADREGRCVLVAGAAGFFAACLFLLFCWIRPAFAVRYMIVFSPAIWLLFAALFLIFSGSWKVFLLVAAGTLAVTGAGLRATLSGSVLLEFETASAFLAANGVKRLSFFWDNPNNQIADEELLRATGGFFLKRRGMDTPVAPFRLAGGAEPGAALKAATPSVGDAFIWIYDTSLRGSGWARFLDGDEKAFTAYRCRRQEVRSESAAPAQGARLGVLVCLRATSD